MSAANDNAQRILEACACTSSGCTCHQAVRRGHGLTHCFVHNDPGPSLNVTVKADKLLVNCQAGCSQKDVLEGLRANDLWVDEREDRGQTARASIVATYDYKDERGKLLFQVCRMVPKSFRQRQPDGNGGWVWSLKGVRVVPYRLPEMLAAADRRVLIVEGEKDVDRLWAEGFVATTNPMGAGRGKWRDEFSAYLRGRKVIVIPDNDDIGQQHMAEVVDSLSKCGSSVTWLALPYSAEHEDVSDWLEQGHTVEELRELALAAGASPKITREDTFSKEGLGYRYEPAQVPLVLQFSRLKDRSDELTAEVVISARDGSTLARRRMNLLAASGQGIGGVAKDLAEEDALGLDQALVKRMLRDSFERVLDSHRNGLEVTSIKGELVRPQAATWLCDGLLLKNKVNCWLGAAGTGKSTLAKALCGYYAAGFRFLGREMESGLPMYLDWEDDADDLRRVFHDVCRDLGVWPVPEVLWLNMRGKRLRDHIERLSEVIDQRGVGLVVLDALAAAGGVPGEHSTYESVALELEQCLGQLPPVTVLGLDHVTSEEHKNGESHVPMKARGAERKVEFFRNQWSLVLDRGELKRGKHVVSWYHTKVNAIIPRKEFVTEVVHRPGELAIVEREITASPSAVERLEIGEQNELYVVQHPGSTASAVCQAVRGSTEKGKVDATRIELKRSVSRGVLSEISGMYYPAGPSRVAEESDELPFDGGGQ